MSKLLIIADDFTGALDTSVQFAKAGIRTAVMSDWDGGGESLDGEEQVLAVNTETRHQTARCAYDVVLRLAQTALRQGYARIYKKTDSALRGNLGSELAAVVDATGQSLAFVPAFPSQGRTTKNGIQFLNGEPIDRSVFGSDGLSPVTCSSVPELLSKQTGIKIIGASLENWTQDTDSGQKTIYVIDAMSDDEIKSIAFRLRDENLTGALAGCAGFASFLPGILGLKAAHERKSVATGTLLIVCGSTNPITLNQIDYAEQNGTLRLRLTPAQIFEPDKANGEPFEIANKNLSVGKSVILQPKSGEVLECYAENAGIPREETAAKVAEGLSRWTLALMNAQPECVPMFIGGDTMSACMRSLDCRRIAPIWEPIPGTVMSEGTVGGRVRKFISKSGGFGHTELLKDLERNMKQEGME